MSRSLLLRQGCLKALPLGPLLRTACLLLLCFSCTGCASLQFWRTSPGSQLADQAPPAPESKEEKALRAWQRFSGESALAEKLNGPMRISAALRYTDAAGETTRVSALLWGNGDTQSPYPLRLDLMAGIGTVVAKIREDSDSFLAYAPDEKTAYTHARGNSNLSSFGVPIPFSLGDLALLLSGRSGRLFLPRSGQTQALPGQYSIGEHSISYRIADAEAPGILELSFTGVPLSWKEAREGGWAMEMEPGETHPLQPQKLRISHPKGYFALVTLKEVARVSPPFTSAQLDLPLPPGTRTEELRAQ